MAPNLPEPGHFQDMGKHSRSCNGSLTALFRKVEDCCILGREQQTIVSDLDGTLLRSERSFPYYMLVALEAGSPIRAFLLLMLSPLVLFVHRFLSSVLAIQILVFVSMAGLKASDVAQVSKAVLPKFYLEDMHPYSYRVFISCGRRYVFTCNPRIMVEPFLKIHMGVDQVLGTEVQITRGGYCTGFVADSGVLMDQQKADAVRKLFAGNLPDVGLANRPLDHPFQSLCKELFIVPAGRSVGPVPRDQYLLPLVFHDGRLVMRPTPLASLAIFLWTPVGFFLALVRMTVALVFPMEVAILLGALLGVRIRVKGAPPLSQGSDYEGRTIFVSTHRTLMDPTFISCALRRRVRTVTYSISRLSEVLSPIKTTRLTRNRGEDEKIIKKLLVKEDLIMCPEGTTCREPFLLRFSSLFAELSNNIVPVATHVRMSMFHGTTARGHKALDPFFFLMNPSPIYEIALLDRLPLEQSCAGGKSSIEVANYLQKQVAEALGFQCTNFTRKDKYALLAGHDGKEKK